MANWIKVTSLATKQEFLVNSVDISEVIIIDGRTTLVMKELDTKYGGNVHQAVKESLDEVHKLLNQET